jgi:hypothetical protein
VVAVPWDFGPGISYQIGHIVQTLKPQNLITIEPNFSPFMDKPSNLIFEKDITKV